MRFVAVLFAVMLLVAGRAAGAEGRPDDLLEAITTEVLADLKGLDAAPSSADRKIVQLVVSKILPVLDLDRMTQVAMGRNWRTATPAQQESLIGEFTTLLVRTYSSALLGYRDQTVLYRRLRLQPEDALVTVKSEVAQPGGQRLSVDYDMERGAEGWKVNDIKFAGVSFVTTYRDSFADEVRQGGVDGLLKSLAAKNRADSRLKKTVQSVRELSLRIFGYVQGALYRGP